MDGTYIIIVNLITVFSVYIVAIGIWRVAVAGVVNKLSNRTEELSCLFSPAHPLHISKARASRIGRDHVSFLTHSVSL